MHIQEGSFICIHYQVEGVYTYCPGMRNHDGGIYIYVHTYVVYFEPGSRLRHQFEYQKSREKEWKHLEKYILQFDNQVINVGRYFLKWE